MKEKFYIVEKVIGLILIIPSVILLITALSHSASISLVDYFQGTIWAPTCHHPSPIIPVAIVMLVCGAYLLKTKNCQKQQ